MDIIIKRGEIVNLEDLPPWSIALDGFVQGPKIDTENHRYSFDHHAGCLRYCTTSACMQAWTAVLLGLDADKYTIYANDVDGDVCAAIWCLKNPEKCSDPRATKLINAMGLGDMHGGAFPNNGMTKTIEWICSPETDSKRDQDYWKLSDNGLNSILEAVLHRIDTYVEGEASIEVSKQPKHGEYKIIRNENNWVLVESTDPHAFSAIYQAGFDRIVLARPQDDNSIAYSIAKKSDFIDRFPLEIMYSKLNELEPGWGGGSTIGGAPRNHDGSRSKLTMEQVAEIIDAIVAEEHISKTKSSLPPDKITLQT